MATIARRLRQALRRRIERIGVIAVPSKYANLFQCAEEGYWDDYFDHADARMDEQWQDVIWPLISDFDFSTVVELAPGGGRNTEKLCRVAKRIFAVDFNQYALERTRARLGTAFNGCEISYHKNSGTDLKMIADGIISAIYCWDSAVHFDKDVLRDYVAEFARVLRTGGKGFVHHSNLGDTAHKNFKKNPGSRSNVSKELFAEFCIENGLQVLVQKDIPWGYIRDCATVFMRP